MWSRLLALALLLLPAQTLPERVNNVSERGAAWAPRLLSRWLTLTRK